MMDRRNGQLFMDLGMGFHPPTDWSLVGLWRLDKLHASYTAGGMKAGTIHTINTLRDCGAIQSEMMATRSAAVQLTFRSSYNLNFEIVRRPGNSQFFCDDNDAYNANYVFKKSLDDYLSMLEGAAGKSYGVRDEMRGSGPAIRDVLQNAYNAVCISATWLLRC